MRTKTLGAAALAGAAAQVILAPVAYAQTAAPPPQEERQEAAAAASPTDPRVKPPASAAAPVTALDEILVTARRRSENLQNVPVAVTAIPETALRAQNLADTRDLARLVPALQFVGGATTKLLNFSTRGVGTFVFSDGFDQSVGVAFDGVPLARSGGSIADLVDIDHVEVLEGPQGMLFGKNASAGLINITTKAPRLGETEGNFRVAYGSFNELQTNATVNLPLGDNFAIRASAWRYRHDGYVDAVDLGRKLGVKDSYGGRLRLRWQPAEGTDINLTGEWTGADQDPSVTTIRVFATDALGVRTYETGRGTPIGPTNLVTTSPTDLFNKASSRAYTLTLDQDVGKHTVSSVTSYRKIQVNENFDPESSNAPLYVSTQGDNVRYKQFSQELRLTSPADQRLRYVLGGIYFHLDLDDYFYSVIVGGTPVPSSVGATTNFTSEHYAAFSEFTFDVTERFRLIAGGRASHDAVKGDLTRALIAPYNPPVPLPPVNGPGASFGPFAYSAKTSSNEPSYRFGAQFDATPDVMLYATASRGYKGPGLDFQFTTTAAAAAATGLIVRPEIAKNYEVGFRSKLFDRKVTLNATAFAEQFQDFQVSTRLPTIAPSFSTQNAKELKTTGVEGTFEIRPGGGLSLSGSASYIHARFTDFTNAACYPREPTAPAGTPPTPGLCINGTQSVNGEPLNNAPKVTANLTARYDTQLSGGQPVYAQVNYRYQGDQVFNAVADPYERQKAYSIVNIGAGVRTADERYGLTFYGKNIFKGEFVYRTVAQLSGAYYAQTVPYDAQRTWGVAFDAKF
jgi:iron complex outermembrane receptor protein